ncbi:MAG: PKD domain-containing protein, partial [Actinomycetota bacterium]|nr:PKD domain-containing protein [Actinomycetota bacterium]
MLVTAFMLVAASGVPGGDSYAASDAPLAAFVAPGIVGSTLSIGFNGAASRGTGLRYAWDFDGSHSFSTAGGTSPVIHHVFTDGGGHEVGLRVTDTAGRSAEVFHAIHVASPPGVELRFAPAHPRPGQLVRFRLLQLTRRAPRAAAGLSLASVTAPEVFLWKFGDHHDGSQQLGSLIFPGFHPTHTSVITHAYARSGRFPMTVQTQDALGNHQAATTVVPVGSCGAAALRTTASASAHGCGPADPPGTNPKGSNKHVQVFVRGYGLFDPASGQPTDFELGFKFKAKPKKPPPGISCEPGSKSFNDDCPEINVPPIVSTKWMFDDGTTENVKAGNGDVIHTFATPGSHAVSVTVTFADGTYSSNSDHFQFYLPQPPAPCPQFSVGPFSGQVDDGSCLIPVSNKDPTLYAVPAGHSIQLGGVTFAPVGDAGLSLSIGDHGRVWTTSKTAKIAVSLNGVGGSLRQSFYLNSSHDEVIHFSYAGSGDGHQGGVGSSSYVGLPLLGADVVMHANGSVSFDNAQVSLGASKQTASLGSLTPDQVANRESDPLALSVPNFSLGGLPLHNVSLTRVPGQGFIGGGDFDLLGAS